MTAARWLEATQREAYSALGGEGCFLRRDARDEALWVSDLPRRADAQTVEAVRRRLAQAGFCSQPEEGLLRVDATLARYEGLLAGLPDALPPLPSDDALHPAYALCRLWLLSPSAPLERQSLHPLRCLLKRLQRPAELLQQIPRLHAESAALLRRREPQPRAAGLVLAEWLQRQSS